MQQYIHARVKEYLLLHKPDYHDFQSYVARLTSDCARPNADYKKSKLIRTNGTDLKQTHKHITRLFELAVDDELAIDEVAHVEVADDAKQFPEAILVQALCADVDMVDAVGM